MDSSATTYFQLGTGFWASIPQTIDHELLLQYAARAQELLVRHQERIPDDDRLHLIVQAGMEAWALYFVATLAEPSTEDLDRYFDHFVTSSVSGIPDFAEERHDH
jgi:hypothetical protein